MNRSFRVSAVKLAVVVLAFCGCQPAAEQSPGDGVTEAHSGIHASCTPKRYGYFGGAPIASVSDHANMDWLSGGVGSGAQTNAALQADAAVGMQAMIELTGVFFNPFPHLSSSYLNDWNNFANAIAPNAGAIAGFYPVDEPNSNGVSDSDLNLAISAIHNFRASDGSRPFANTPVAVIYRTGFRSNVPSSVGLYDWVGFDCYDLGGFRDNCAFDIEQFNAIKAHLKPGGRTIVVPQAFVEPNNDTALDASHLSVIMGTNPIATMIQDPATIAVIPFAWKDFTGVRGLATVDSEWRQFSVLDGFKFHAREFLDLTTSGCK